MKEPPHEAKPSELAPPPVEDQQPGPPQGAEPPDPPGYVPPLVYGREPPRPGPHDRSSVWEVHDPGGTIRHVVQCDTLEEPQLREVLSVLFAGAAPSDSLPVLPPHATLLLQIDWLEHGETIAVSKLYSDGSLVREQDGKHTLDRKLDGDALAAVEAAIGSAGLRDASRKWCEPDQ